MAWTVGPHSPEVFHSLMSMWRLAEEKEFNVSEEKL
jgi:hypothetical protein